VADPADERQGPLGRGKVETHSASTPKPQSGDTAAKRKKAAEAKPAAQSTGKAAPPAKDVASKAAGKPPAKKPAKPVKLAKPAKDDEDEENEESDEADVAAPAKAKSAKPAPKSKVPPPKKKAKSGDDDDDAADEDDVAIAAAEADAEGVDFGGPLGAPPAPPPPRVIPKSAPEAPPAPAVKPPPVPTNLPPRRADGVITLAHSPDADDAFMFFALANGLVDTEDRKYEHTLKDIQTLNESAKKGTYDVTAISFHAYPYVRQNYRLLTCGASFGDGYGPVLVAKTPIRPSEVEGLVVAIPGELTTAALVTRLWFNRSKIKTISVPFDRIADAVLGGLARAGVLIHEGQLTYRDQGLTRVKDFGQWWAEETEGLPLPLGGNGIRRDIATPIAQKIALDLKRSIAYALGHREEALAYAMKFSRNLPKDKADKFVGMYVNELTLDYGERGRQAVLHLLDRAFRAGLLPEAVVPEFV
jgi:1,4-dihydroxy-6-naphthoate synthase